MRTFEFKDGKSNKFWNIELQGKQFTVTFGKIGTAGQTQTKDFADEAKARAAHDKLVAEKLGKGYVETSGKQSAKAAGPSPLQKSLEEALVENPDDLAAHAAYADYLTEQGDPRGEFIQVQLALEDSKRSASERKELQSRERSLLKKHVREWLGEVGTYLVDGVTEDLPDYMQDNSGPRGEYTFARGWLDTLRVGWLTTPFAKILGAAPELRLLQRFTVGQIDYDEADLTPLAKSEYLTNLRLLQLGEEEGRGGSNGEGAVDFIARLPRLEELHLLVHGIDTEKLFALKSLANLRFLRVYHLTDYPLERLANNPALRNLTHLLLWPHALTPDDTEPYIRLPQVRALVRSKHLTKLTHLQIRLTDMGDAGCREIVDSGILSRLKSLELQGGCISDEGAHVLASCADLKNLELLNVSRNCLTEAGIKALKIGKLKVQAENQWQATGDEYGDTEYLADGDWE